jgi:hypothetical protein
LRIYNGDFIARWSSSQDSFDLRVESTDLNAPPELKQAFIRTRLVRMMGVAMTSGSRQNSMLSDAIPREDMQILGRRATHHFLRQHAGSRLPTELFVLACATLVTEMASSNRQEEPLRIEESTMVDEAHKLSVLLVDGLSTLEISEKTRVHVGKMGESLEAIGKFVEAAKVYERLVQSGEVG